MTMMRALHLLDGNTEFREIETDFKIIESFYIKTNKGILFAARIFKDTPNNRQLLEQITNEQKVFNKAKEAHETRFYKLLNQKD